jgi:hypothetical protein
MMGFGHRGQAMNVYSRGAFSVVEAVFSITLVGGLLVVALDTVGASAVAQQGIEQRTIAKMLASELMTEVLVLDYEDTNETPSFGIESSEASGGRVNFDDLDDYAGWSEAPPQTKDGTVRTEYQGWRSLVSVQRVDPSNYKNLSISDTGLRKITVRVLFNNQPREMLTALRWGKSSAVIAPDPPVLEQ